MSSRKAVILAHAFAALVLLASPAHAVFRAYVAADGNDANPCTLTSPCRLLPAALTAVDSGGEIWMLDSANYNTAQVDITKSVTILAVPGAVGSVVATGGVSASALYMNAAGISVTLRNLVVVQLGTSLAGAYMTNGSQLTIQSCDFSGLDGGGGAVYMGAATGVLTINDSIVRGAAYGVAITAGGTLAMDRTRLENNNIGVVVNNSRATLNESFFAGNNIGVYVTAQGGNSATATIRNSAIAGRGSSGSGINLQTVAIGDSGFVNLVNSSITHVSAGIHTIGVAGATTTLLLDGNSITDNVFPITFTGPAPTVLTRQNNTVRHNAGGDSIGTFTPVSPQ